MNRSQKVRAIYIELMGSLEGAMPRREVLSLAVQLLDQYDSDRTYDGYGNTDDSIVPDCEAVDVALADGGWRLRARERLFRDAHFDEDPQLQDRSRNRLHTIMQRAA